MSELAAEGLTLTRGGVRILDDVSANFAPGGVSVVLGPNGAGKSTLMGCLAGLVVPDRGAVTLDGAPRSQLTRREAARKIGYLPQSADVHWDIDVETLVALGRHPHREGWGLGVSDRAAIARAIAATDIASLAARIVTTLSGGERARVLLARVLAGEPQWLLADEPLANLDPAHQLDGLDNLRRAAAAGAGVVVVLHDLNHAARIADNVLLMRSGRVIAYGPPQELLTPERIAEVYGIAAHIGTTPDGQRYVISTHKLDRTPTTEPHHDR